eukprot:m.48647 g.48647  ORF g.48647 m.48647 type:complete len:61 (+) comp11052_c0_seq1:274-456(+)
MGMQAVYSNGITKSTNRPTNQANTSPKTKSKQGKKKMTNKHKTTRSDHCDGSQIHSDGVF